MKPDEAAKITQRFLEDEISWPLDDDEREAIQTLLTERQELKEWAEMWRETKEQLIRDTVNQPIQDVHIAQLAALVLFLEALDGHRELPED